ncbi:hypothetical protein [Nocardia sp. No.11]|uniref:hypothetical protein n=1 Tax=Nocardia sp. No.11 TaxID=3128861 RepID=UPI00319DF902
MTEIDGQTTIEFTTTRGRTVRVGDRYHDAREHNRRVLKVESLGVYQPAEYGGVQKPPVCSVTCSVTRPRGDGIELMKPTTMDANRITGRDFVLIEDEPTRVDVTINAPVAKGGAL